MHPLTQRTRIVSQPHRKTKEVNHSTHGVLTPRPSPARRAIPGRQNCALGKLRHPWSWRPTTSTLWLNALAEEEFSTHPNNESGVSHNAGSGQRPMLSIKSAARTPECP